MAFGIRFRVAKPLFIGFVCRLEVYRVIFIVLSKAGGNDFAIVSSKYYDLPKGRIILVSQDQANQYILLDAQLPDATTYSFDQLKFTLVSSLRSRTVNR